MIKMTILYSSHIDPMSPLFYVLMMTSQSIADDIKHTLCNVKNVMQVHKKQYLTLQILILFTALFTAGHVRNFICLHLMCELWGVYLWDLWDLITLLCCISLCDAFTILMALDLCSHWQHYWGWWACPLWHQWLKTWLIIYFGRYHGRQENSDAILS